MRPISLVVCICRERELLARLLQESAGLYDDLVVVHDGPEQPEPEKPAVIAAPGANALDFSRIDPGTPPIPVYREPNVPPRPGSIHELVVKHGGRFFEGPRCFQQEPHWPFAWSQARHDWILRLDADEYPSVEMKMWLEGCRAAPEPPADVSGYTCIWPLWDGVRAVTRRWPAGRIFFIHRRRVRFFGMAEQVPVPDGRYEPLALVLRHEPVRKSYGLKNILVRRQGSVWRRVIAQSLLGSPLDLPRWRWQSAEWPEFWSRLRARPVRYGLYSFLRGTAVTIRDQWRTERTFKPLMALAGPLHHLLIALLYRSMKRKPQRPPTAAS